MRRTTVGAALAALFVAGCADIAITCTSDPCPYGLQIQLLGYLPDAYTLEVLPTEYGEPWVVECTAEEPCEDDLFSFPFFVPPHPILTFRSADTVVVDTLQPEYRTRERSESCGGDCHFAYVEWRVPGFGAGEHLQDRTPGSIRESLEVRLRTPESPDK